MTRRIILPALGLGLLPFLALGQAPGPDLGKLLDDIRHRQLAGELTNREQALAYARESLG